MTLTGIIIAAVVATLIIAAKAALEAKFPVPDITDAHVAVLAELEEHGPMPPLEIAKRLDCGVDDPDGILAIGSLLEECAFYGVAAVDGSGTWRITPYGKKMRQVWEAAAEASP